MINIKYLKFSDFNDLSSLVLLAYCPGQALPIADEDKALLPDEAGKHVFLSSDAKLLCLYRLPEVINVATLRVSMAKAFRLVPKVYRDRLAVSLTDLSDHVDDEALGRVLAEALILSSYTYKLRDTLDVVFDQPESETKLKLLDFQGDRDKFAVGSSVGEEIALSICQARDLANRPANLLKPVDFVNFAKRVFDATEIEVDVIDETRAAEMGMGSFLGVGQGSDAASYILCLRYRVTSGAKPIALVGKGVTFDSGGISIKPSKGMGEMKGDMGGAAAVFSAMLGIERLAVDVPILALIPLAENMPSGTAQRPGDVVRAMDGTRIEIINTDAEGRLVMADAICYAKQEEARAIVDISTLTGSCVVALGTLASGLFSNDDALADIFEKNAVDTGERVWRLPLYDEYLDDLKSNVADLANCSESRYGGACTAAKFLQHFAGETPWVHLDIAPVMSASKASGLKTKGMTGEGTYNLIAFIQSMAKREA